MKVHSFNRTSSSLLLSQQNPKSLLLSFSIYGEGVRRADEAGEGPGLRRYIHKELHLLNSRWAVKPKSPV